MGFRICMAAGTLLGTLIVAGSAAAETPSGAALGATCAGCHGTDGNSAGPATPGIAGIKSKYFVDSMKAFQQEQRPATVMNRIAKAYSDAEIAAMADFFSTRRFLPLEKQPYSAALASRGEGLHKRYCEKCHEDNGTRRGDATPLAGQPRQYLSWALQEFASGQRPMPEKMQRPMEQLYLREGDQGLAALVDFYASQADKQGGR